MNLSYPRVYCLNTFRNQRKIYTKMHSVKENNLFLQLHLITFNGIWTLGRMPLGRMDTWSKFYLLFYPLY
jgi:hypothetical protein